MSRGGADAAPRALILQVLSLTLLTSHCRLPLWQLGACPSLLSAFLHTSY